MINCDEAKVLAWKTISEVVGLDYFRANFETACEAQTPNNDDDPLFDYFLGFDGDDDSNKWSVFVKVVVNRETQTVEIMDYKTPDGIRMENPPHPISFA